MQLKVILATSLLAVSIIACAGVSGDPDPASVTPDEMPEGGYRYWTPVKIYAARPMPLGEDNLHIVNDPHLSEPDQTINVTREQEESQH